MIFECDQCGKDLSEQDVFFETDSDGNSSTLCFDCWVYMNDLKLEE